MPDNLRTRSVAWLLVPPLCAALLCACAAASPIAPTSVPPGPAPVTSQPSPYTPVHALPLVTPPVATARCADLPAESDAPVIAPPGDQDKQPEDTSDSPAADAGTETTKPISYDAATNTILLAGGAPGT